MVDGRVGVEAPLRKSPVRRSAEERARIVAESYEPGKTVAGVARRHGIVPSQLSSWRSAARAKATETDRGLQFAAVSIVPEPLAAVAALGDSIEVVVGAVVIRLPRSTTSRRIADIAQRLSGSQ
ncbi:MAG: transposase [Rhodobacteraceae bacterium]|nr:transposase [Paracoccaceae bacterium]